MRSKIFNTLLLIVLISSPGRICAQYINENVISKYLEVVNPDNGSETKSTHYISADTGNNNIYIFTAPQVAEFIEFDKDGQVLYLYNNNQSLADDNNIELIKNYSKSYLVNVNDKLVID